MQAISARGLRKTYGSTTALAGVGIDIVPGEAVAIMGASGSGKTTLLHALAGIVTPDVGAVHLATPTGIVDVARLSDAERTRLRRERFGFVFQEDMLVPELTAVENVALALMLVGAPASRPTRRRLRAACSRSFGSHRSSSLTHPDPRRPRARQRPRCASTAVVMARTAVSSVGCSTGTNAGEWFVGISVSTVPAATAAAWRASSMPPVNQKQ